MIKGAQLQKLREEIQQPADTEDLLAELEAAPLNYSVGAGGLPNCEVSRVCNGPRDGAVSRWGHWCHLGHHPGPPC